MQPRDFAALSAADPINLVFPIGNDGDSQSTDFWVDAVRFCVAGTDNPSWPDLVTLDLEEIDQDCSDADAGGGIRLTVANRGQADAADFYVRIATQGTYRQWRVTTLPAGESREFTWCGAPGLFPYIGTVDEQDMVVESDETNNQVRTVFRYGAFWPLFMP
jgi:hypothetical protein